MKRREFIASVAGLAIVSAGWPRTAAAQQRKRATIGFLGATTASAASQWTAALVKRLHELGWAEGGNLAIEYRWVEGQSDRSAAIVEEFIRLKVDLIVTYATANVIAAKNATSAIPIVFALAADPVGNKLVESLAHPGGNVTGLSLQRLDLAGKRLELMREVFPGLRRLAVLVNAASNTAAQEIDEIQTASRVLGVEVLTSPVRRAEDFAAALGAMKGHMDALYVPGDALMNANHIQINSLALAARLPTVYSLREQVEAGGLMSYGPSYPDMFRRTAELVDKILRGAKPADIPVEQPSKFELVINLKTAKTLGLTIPESFLLRADAVIE